MQNVWSLSGVLIVYGGALDAQEHKHNAIQIIWPSDACRLNVAQQEISRAAIIDANVPHQLHMQSGWVLLIEPQSQLGEDLQRVLNNQQVVPLSGLDYFSSKAEFNVASPLTLLDPLFRHVFNEQPVKYSLLSYLQLIPSENLDARIKTLLHELNACFEQACLKPESWKAVDVASTLNLSQGRFLHLFKEQMGIAWRPYLLWRRMLCAVALLISGKSATEAAHVAGFSDSAHLSRSFRSMFGLSIRDAGHVLQSDKS